MQNETGKHVDRISWIRLFFMTAIVLIRKILKIFSAPAFLTYKNKDYPLKSWLLTAKQICWAFFQSDRELTASVFTLWSSAAWVLALYWFYRCWGLSQRNGLSHYIWRLIGKSLPAAQHWTKNGNSLVDKLVSEDLIPEDNTHHYFNGKSLATFSSHDAIREVVYVESRVDTDQDGRPISRSALSVLVTKENPAVMTASPYHQGTMILPAIRRFMIWMWT